MRRSLRFRDRDQLLDLAELLQDRGAVGLRQRRLDAAPAGRLSSTACPMRGRPPSGAMTRPPLMLCTRLVRFGIGDDAADQADGALRRLRRQLLGAHVEQPLGRLRHEDVPVRQPAR